MKILNSVHARWIMLLTIIVAATGLLFYLSYIDVKNLAIIEFNKQQMLLAEQAVSGIEGFFNNLENDLDSVSKFEDIALMNNNGKRLASALMKKDRSLLYSVTRVDEKGRILWLDPENSSLIGKDISDQKQIKNIIKTHQPSISDFFTAVQGYRTISYHYPVFYKGDYKGSLGVLINFDYISKKYIENIRIGDAGYAWILSADGVELYCPVPGHKGQPVYETSGIFPDVMDMAERMISGEKGTAVYRYNVNKNDHLENLLKHAAFAPINIVNTHWSIVVATPEEYILSSVKGFKNKSLMILSLLIIISILFYYFLFRVWIYVNEIKNKVRVESAIRENEENLRITLNSIGDAIISTDEKGNIKRMNPAAETITGWKVKDARGLSLEKVFTVLDPVNEIKKENLYTQIIHPGEIMEISESAILSDRKGIKRKISLTAASIMDVSGKKVGAVIVFRDISEKIRIEEQLRQSQKMDIIGKLTGGFVHDFNNMLAGILNASEVLEMKLGNDEKTMKFISFIKDTALKASDLTQKLLFFPRKGVHVSESVDVHSSISIAVDILQHGDRPDIKILKFLNAEKSIISGDPSQIQSIIQNLVVNAKEAMPAGGEIIIQSVNMIMDEDNCLKSGFELKPGLYIKISVKDTGCGFDDELKSKIFEPFFTTKTSQDGVGLGLSVVYGNVKDLGGAIEVYSVKGSGSVFDIYFPVIENVVWDTEKDESIVRGQGRILVVDDEFILRNLTERILCDLGYEVVTADNGKSALDIFREEFKKVDVVLMDVVMPVMGGIEALKEFKKIDPSVIIYLATGNMKD